MPENRFAFTTDDPEVAAKILAVMSGAPVAATSKKAEKAAAAAAPPAAPMQTPPPPGVPGPAPVAPPPVHTPPPPAAPPAPPVPAAPPAPPVAAPPPPAPEPAPVQALPGWDFDRDIKPRLQAFVGKYSGAELKKYLTEHFGVGSGVQVLAAEWPRLVEALDNAVNG